MMRSDSDKEILNLAAAAKLIQIYISDNMADFHGKIDYAGLSKGQLAQYRFLNQLLTRIQAIGNTQRGWLKIPMQDKKGKDFLHAENLLKTHWQTIKFTQIAVQALLYDVLCALLKEIMPPLKGKDQQEQDIVEILANLDILVEDNTKRDQENLLKLLNSVLSGLEKVISNKSEEVSTENITWDQIQDRLITLLEHKKLKTSPYRHLLYKIATCAVHILSDIDKRIEKRRESGLIKESLNKEERDFYYKNRLSHYAHLMGGYSFLSAQAYDPLLGKMKNKNQIEAHEGACYGYMMVWRDEIQKEGKCSSLPRLDIKTFIYQDQEESNHKLQWHAFYEDFVDDAAILHIADHFTERLKPGLIYSLNLKPPNRSMGHAIGVRMLESNIIELFDPNFGIFTFPNKTNFSIWLTALLKNYYIQDQVGIHLNLYEIGQQPSSAAPSFAFEEAVEKNPLFLRDITIKELKPHIRKFVNQADESSIPKLLYMISKDFEFLAHVAICSAGERKQEYPDENLITIFQSIQDKAYSEIDQNILKAPVISLIDAEINKNPEIESSLAKLKSDIEQATPYHTLAGVVIAWKQALTLKEQTIIHQTDLPYHLMQHYEISPINLNLLQEMVFRKISQLVLERDWSAKMPLMSRGATSENNKKLPQGISDMREDMSQWEDNQQMGVRKMLQVFKSYGDKKHANWMWSQAKRRHPDLNTLYRLFKMLKVDDPYSLRATYKQLELYDQKVFKKRSPTVITPSLHSSRS